jgi:hypothetical protein
MQGVILLRKSIKLTNGNSKINKSLLFGARVALQIISIFFELRDFLPVENYLLMN